MSIHPRFPEWAQWPEPTFPGDAEDEICGLQMECGEIADFFRAIEMRDPEDYDTPGWRSEIRRLVLDAREAMRKFSQ